MSRRAAIILSGGKAERFQSEKQAWQDKALVELLGKPLLVHAVQNVQNLVDEIVVVVNDENRLAWYSEVLATHHVTGVRLVSDVKIDRLGGPLVAIFTGLKSVRADNCLTLPSDMPLLQPKVIEYMFRSAGESPVAVPMWPNGRLETLVMVLERKSVLEIADTLSSLKRPRSDDIIRGALKVLFLSIVGEIRALDPDLKSFVNINVPEDLIELQPRRVQGTLTENMKLNLGEIPTFELNLLRDASTLVQDGNFFEAAEVFASCGDLMEKRRTFFWAAISRENEGKSTLKWTKQLDVPELAAARVVEARNALLKAATNYRLEADMHERNCYPFLAERARSDEAWCQSRSHELAVQKLR